jgi:hypothetical protein
VGSHKVTNWYVDCRLDSQILVQEQFYTGYGLYDYPSTTNVINSINSGLTALYNYGLNFYFAGNTLIISNTTCYDDFTNKQLYLNIGVDIQINCVQQTTPTPTPTPTATPAPTPCVTYQWAITFAPPGGSYQTYDCFGNPSTNNYIGGGTFNACSSQMITSTSPRFVSAINSGLCP